MGTITIGPRSFDIELPFHLDVLEKAADAIDRSNQAVEELVKLQEDEERVPFTLSVRVLTASVEALHIAIAHSNPKVTLQDIRSLVSLGDAKAVADALNQALTLSGLAPKGEAKAPAAAPGPRRSKSKSGASSATSSSPASAAATG